MAADGHRAGADVFKNLLGWCKEAGIKEVSFWGLSTENLKRSKIELEFLFKLFEELCDEIIKNYKADSSKDRVRVKFCGEINRLPEWLVKKMREAEEVTKDFEDYKLNLLVAYGGRYEILQAVKSIAKDAKEGKIDPEFLTDDAIRSRLHVQSDPDLIVRTGHACLSGLLPWQGTYAEIIFLDKFWPDFSKEDLQACLDEFSKRKRNFGK